MKILFVCHGNINRSAAGEIILKRMLRLRDIDGWEVKSAALKETKGNEITAKKMRDALNELEIPTTGIRSTPISQELVDWADRIFYMDDSNENKLDEKFGNSIFHKATRLGNFIGVKKIPDPNFAKGNELHKQVVLMIVVALEKFIDGLSIKGE